MRTQKKMVGVVKYNQSRVIDTILESFEARVVYQELLEKKNQPILLSKTKSKKILAELTSSNSHQAIQASYWIVTLLQKSMFKNIHTYGDGLDSVYKLTSENKIIFFLPNHKSHMDYILLSYILYINGIAPPHIAAGVNLAFWPMDQVFRSTGAYFIRRKIAGNFLYTKLLELYFDWMLKHKISQEFYMEGGRSRDGKIRQAQTGILRLFAEQIEILGLQSEIYIAPISITYDRVPEMESLIREVKGLKKKRESVVSLFSSLTKIFRSHGHVHFYFDQPLSLQASGLRDTSKKSYSDSSHKIFSKIQKNKTITMSGILAAVLLSLKVPISSEDLLLKIGKLIQILRSHRDHMSNDVNDLSSKWKKLLRSYEKIGWFHYEDNKLTINKRKKLEINYYKNDLMPILLPFSLQVLKNEFSSNQFSVAETILQHEFPYSDISFEKSNAESSTFLKSIHTPIFYLYREVLLTLLKIHPENLGLSETHRMIRYTLRDQKFLYKEVLTIDSVRSVCDFYHDHENIWKSGASDMVATLECILERLE